MQCINKLPPPKNYKHGNNGGNPILKENSNVTKRIKWIDALRGFSMFFVVYYHIQVFALGLTLDESILGNILVSFIMPTFFFISGFIAYQCWNKWTNSFYVKRLTNKARVQLIPTFVFFSLHVLIGGGNNPVAVYVSNGLGGFWFTFVLFEFFLVYFSLSWITRHFNGKGFNLTALLLGIGGVVLIIILHSESSWWKMLCITPFLRYMQFFLIGVICRKYQSKLFEYLDKDWFITANMLLFIASAFLICMSNNVKVEYGILGSFVNDILIRYTGLFIVLTCFYKGADYFNNDNFITQSLCLMGRRSLDIYMIHNFLMPHLFILTPLFTDKNNIVLEFWTIFFVTMLVVAFALMIGSILRNSKFLGYYLLGAKY